MDEIVKKIIDMDRDTVKIKLKTEEIIVNREKELKETLQELEKKYLEESRLEGDRIYKEIIKTGESEMTRLESSDIEALKKIDNIYKGKKQILVEDLFKNLFMNKE